MADVTDNFNGRGDEVPLSYGGKWGTSMDLGVPLQAWYLSTAAGANYAWGWNGTGGGRKTVGLSWWQGDTFADDQYAQLYLYQQGIYGMAGAGIRWDRPTSTTPRYGYGPIGHTGVASFNLRRYVNGVETDLATYLTLPVYNTTLRSVSIGTALTCYSDANLRMSATDSTFSSGSPALVANSVSPIYVDNWLAGPTAGRSRRMILSRGEYDIDWRILAGMGLFGLVMQNPDMSRRDLLSLGLGKYLGRPRA